MIDLAEMLIERAPGADEQGVLRQFRVRGERHRDQDDLVHEQRARAGRRRRRSSAALKGYHGITLAAASLTGLPANHKLFDLPLPGFIHVGDAAPLPRRASRARPRRISPRACADELEELILEEGPETVAAFFAEPVMGAGGVIVPPARPTSRRSRRC